MEVMDADLRKEFRKYQRILRLNFNGGLKELKRWQDVYPRACFGFSGVITDESRRHPQTMDVLAALPLDRILLESDSPEHLATAFYGREEFNTPYWVEEVAHCISLAKNLSLHAVIEQCNANARSLYRMYL